MGHVAKDTLDMTLQHTFAALFCLGRPAQPVLPQKLGRPLDHLGATSMATIFLAPPLLDTFRSDLQAFIERLSQIGGDYVVSLTGEDEDLFVPERVDLGVGRIEGRVDGIGAFQKVLEGSWKSSRRSVGFHAVRSE